MEVPDDRLHPADRLAVEFDVESQPPVGGGMLRTHVEDLDLVLGRLSSRDVVVDDDRTPLSGEDRLRFVGEYFLRALIGEAAHLVRRLGAAHPHLVHAASLRWRRGDVGGLGLLGVGRSFEIAGDDVGRLAHVAFSGSWWPVAGLPTDVSWVRSDAALNTTGTEPTGESLRSGCPCQSSGSRSRVRSG